MGRTYFIPLNVPSSKNSKVFTGRFLVWSKAAQKYRKLTKEIYSVNGHLFREELKNYVLPVKVSFEFIRGSKHKFDLVNPLQTVLDLMVENNWIEDDNADIIIPVFEKYKYDKLNPGVNITIL